MESRELELVSVLVAVVVVVVAVVVVVVVLVVVGGGGGAGGGQDAGGLSDQVGHEQQRLSAIRSYTGGCRKLGQLRCFSKKDKK